MSNTNLDETIPITPVEPPAPPKTTFRWKRWLALGVIGVLITALLSAWGGWQKGNQIHQSVESTQQAIDLNEQYNLAVQDLESELCDRAIFRFEHILQDDPTYPGAAQGLEDALFCTLRTATFTPVPTATLTPTVDLRGADQLFTTAQGHLAAGEWTQTLETLDSLRNEYFDYKPVEVDGMYYVAYRNRGVDRILTGDLEGGIYDIDQAEKFGPLDSEAGNLRLWAGWYKTGASFWEIDWGQAVAYFEQLVLVAPNLYDSSNMTATERYRLAAWYYGIDLADAGEWCMAHYYISISMSYGSTAEQGPFATAVAGNCFTPTPRPRPTATPTPTPSPSPSPEG